MSKPIAPVLAYCAIGPTALIDLDLVRRSPAAAQWAAGNIEGAAWPVLASRGWRVVPVRVSAEPGAGEDDAPPPRKPPPRHVASKVVPPAAVPAPAGESRMRLLRLGALP